MASDHEEVDRTEAPSPRWAARAREQGSWPRSGELVAACAMLAGLLAIRACSEPILGHLADSLGSALTAFDLTGDTTSGADLRIALLAHLARLLPLLLVPAVMAVVVCLGQTGIQFRLERCLPDLGRLNGLGVLGRAFTGKAGGEALFRVAKWFVVVGLAMWWLGTRRAMADETINGSPGEMMGAWCLDCLGVGIKMAFVFVGFGVLDYAWAWRSYIDQMRMSRGELLAEMRETEGDPAIRRRRRQWQVDHSSRRWEKILEPGDLVITARNRLAVAVRLDGTGGARLLLKGVGSMSNALLGSARSRGIRTLRNERLAHLILHAARPGSYLPASLNASLREAAVAGDNRRRGENRSFTGTAKN